MVENAVHTVSTILRGEALKATLSFPVFLRKREGNWGRRLRRLRYSCFLFRTTTVTVAVGAVRSLAAVKTARSEASDCSAVT